MARKNSGRSRRSGESYVELDFPLPTDGLTPDLVDRALREDAHYFGHSIVIQENGIYRGLSGVLKYETVVV